MRIRFDRGTLVLAPDAGEDPAAFGARWDDDTLEWRAHASAHRDIVQALRVAGHRVDDEVQVVDLAGALDEPELRWYQREALDAWSKAGHRGVIALPTGSGKTMCAVAAMARLGVAALVLVPTRVLLEQWIAVLARYWPGRVGQLGDGVRVIHDITVATYASAILHVEMIGDRFGLVVVDEAHHVGAMCPTDLLQMLVAPTRLGLTATPPERPLSLGPVVYTRSVAELTGDGLAVFTHEELVVKLGAAERVRYAQLRGVFKAAYASYVRRSPDAKWHEFAAAMRGSRSGREVLDAWRGYRQILAYPAAKRAALGELLARHAGERTLVFTADNATAYAIARELLVQPITHEIGRTERTAAIGRFASGETSVLVSAQVLDEGLDVPDAEIAIIVGGTASARKHVQRVGRVLRPRPDKRAVVYELVVENTQETDYSKRRRAGFDTTRVGGAP